MDISEKDIVVGGVYKTPTNQERLVLAIEGGKVKYASRGGFVKNPFEHLESSEPSRFAKACSERVADLPSEEFEAIQQLFRDKQLIS